MDQEQLKKRLAELEAEKQKQKPKKKMVDDIRKKGGK